MDLDVGGEVSILRLKDGVRYRKEKFGGLIFDPDTAMILEVNNAGLKIIKLLKNGISDDLLRRRLGRRFQDKTKRFLAVLKKLNLSKEAVDEEIS
jgi:hypothetical protein